MTKEEMASRLLQFGDFNCKNDVFFQKEEAISLFERNRKEQISMDDHVRNAKVTDHVKRNQTDKLSGFFKSYATDIIIEKNTVLIDSIANRKVAIDCGCGKGEYLRVLSHKFDLVIAIDLSLEAITYSKNAHKDLENIIYVNGSMLDFYKVFTRPIADFCLSAEVIEHVPCPKFYLKSINNLLKNDGNLLISTPCQNLYFYPFQFLRTSLTKPRTLIKLLNPLGNWEFALNWHPALSKKDFIGILNENGFRESVYLNFLPYYDDTFPLMFYLAKVLPKDFGLKFYRKYLSSYNRFVENIGLGIRQHVLCLKEDEC